VSGGNGTAAGLRAAAAITGAYEHPTRFAADKSEWLLQAEAVIGALEDAGLEKKDVDAYFTVATSPEGGYLRESPGAMMADYLNIRPRFVDDTDIGGASFGVHLNRAILGINAGLFRCAVIGYGACTRSQGIRVGTRNWDDLMGRDVLPFPDSFMEPFGTTIVGYVGMVTHRYMHDTGLTREQLARVPVSAREHAARNPDAAMREPITIEDVLSSPVIASPIHRLDCCIISDGAGALVVSSPELAKSAPKEPVWILGFGEAVCNSKGGKADWVADFREMTAEAGDQAFSIAGVERSAIDTAMVYDAFSVTVVQAIEALGLCGDTHPGEFVAGGCIDLGGPLPVNPDGGGLSSNHPGRRGLFLLIEAVRQLRNECNGRQVGGAALALVNASGSAYMGVQGSTTHILGRA
jgi:acetyl-CoA C-acetyltransferase